MRTSLWIILILLVVVVGSSSAFADTVSEDCGAPVIISGTGTAISGPQGPASFTCGSLSVGAGDVISQVQLFYAVDYAFGNTPGTNSVVWKFNTGAGTWSGASTETVTGGFSPSLTTPGEGAGFLDAPFGAVVVGPGQINTTDLGVGTDTFAGVTVTAPVSIIGGVVSTTGDLFAQVTYAPSVVTAPEPGTAGLMLIGMGVLLAGAMRKRKQSHPRVA